MDVTLKADNIFTKTGKHKLTSVMISTPEYYKQFTSTVTISIGRRRVQSCKHQHINLINTYEEDGYGKSTRSEDRKLFCSTPMKYCST